MSQHEACLWLSQLPMAGRDAESNRYVTEKNKNSQTFGKIKRERSWLVGAHSKLPDVT